MELNLKLTCDTCGGNQFVYPEDNLQDDSPVTCSGCGTVRSFSELQASSLAKGIDIFKKGIRG